MVCGMDNNPPAGPAILLAALAGMILTYAGIVWLVLLTAGLTLRS